MFFFFQAEDGIRDRNVTGVQTCALPIFAGRAGRGRTFVLARLGQSGRASFSAHAVTTAELGVSPPEIVAQPPFSMIERWSHEVALENSANFTVASDCCRNFSTQIGVKTVTTAV